MFLILDDMDSMLGATDVMPHYKQRFISGGMNFSRAFVSSPKCCPSRTSLLSGRFAHRLADPTLGWCGDFVSQSRYDAMFIAQLRDSGYQTGFFGKMTNDMGPMCKQGVAHVPTGFNVSDGDKFFAMCNEVVFYGNTINNDGKLFTTGESGGKNYLQAVIGNATIPWLERVAAASAQPGGKPFFAYLAPHAPHFPAEPAPWYAEAPLPSETAPRLPSYNVTGVGADWAINENAPFNDFTAAGIDLHFRNRQRSLMSVDDYVRDIFATLENAGVLGNTILFATSDHGYHLGQYRIPYEKSHAYEIDVRVPFFAAGAGVPAGSTQPALISLIDVGATVLELAGVTAPGQRSTDGRSFASLLAGPAPADWRKSVLVEMMGVDNQWMSVCGWVFNASCPPPDGEDPLYLIDGPQNTFVMLRLINETADLSYAEYRAADKAPAPDATNFTLLYDNSADPYQLTSLASSAPPSVLADLSRQLWDVANCALDSCP